MVDNPHMGCVLALDYGNKRTGVAISDSTRTIVRPLDTILKANSSDGLDTIAALVLENDIKRVIVGLPLSLNGSETKQTARSRSFAARLKTHIDTPIELYDERFTSKLADHTTSTTGSSTSRDSLAACHLLESWMETKK